MVLSSLSHYCAMPSHFKLCNMRLTYLLTYWPQRTTEYLLWYDCRCIAYTQELAERFSEKNANWTIRQNQYISISVKTSFIGKESNQLISTHFNPRDQGISILIISHFPKDVYNFSPKFLRVNVEHGLFVWSTVYVYNVLGCNIQPYDNGTLLYHQMYFAMICMYRVTSQTKVLR